MNIGDIVEREVDSATVKPPGPGDMRPKKQSRWKQRMKAQKEQEPEVPASSKGGLSATEQIHMENLQKISQMSQAEFEQNRDELLGSLDSGVLQMLLKRAKAHEGGMLDEDDVNRALNPLNSSETLSNMEEFQPSIQPSSEEHPIVESQPEFNNEEPINEGPNEEPTNEELANEANEEPTIEKASGVHFPAPPQRQELDVNDPGFMEQLHAKYFPTLETEPEKLQWMQPVGEEDMTSYTEDQGAVAPSELRFDFHGDLLSPRQALQVPTHRGLHHHGDAPHAAGYTIAELGHLARSTVASQRCIAIQTLGRVLYKLGKGLYGKEISMGLWGVVDYARVLDTLHEAADEAHTKSLTVRAHAVEALWLWHQGGGHRLAR
ncbi:RNA polymerase II-associated protein Rba50p [Trichomonascus vanleenenianus]|uniref:Rba50p n=1 Tax=Trichomonascus vanleenenianus TaxID=2268995 RepID=UPI003ECAFF53